MHLGQPRPDLHAGILQADHLNALRKPIKNRCLTTHIVAWHLFLIKAVQQSHRTACMKKYNIRLGRKNIRFRHFQQSCKCLSRKQRVKEDAFERGHLAHGVSALDGRTVRALSAGKMHLHVSGLDRASVAAELCGLCDIFAKRLRMAEAAADGDRRCNRLRVEKFRSEQDAAVCRARAAAAEDVINFDASCGRLLVQLAHDIDIAEHAERPCRTRLDDIRGTPLCLEHLANGADRAVQG